MGAKCDVQFLLFAAILCAAVAAGAAAEAAAAAAPANVVEICTQAVKDDELSSFCSQVFLKDKAGQLSDVNDWEKNSRVVITHGASNAASIEKFVEQLANNQSLSMYERATLNLCVQSLKRGAEQIAEAAAAFNKMEKVDVHGLKDVQILMDDGKSSQGKCEDMLEPQQSLANVFKEVHDAFTATRIVTRFLTHVKIDQP